ncbi:MAG: TrkA family potassium uptake protein [Desulfovibrionaceae bacterium]|nr:TrkA family potassium uptake protein [Desulfovibrionaceae bacterium]
MEVGVVGLGKFGLTLAESLVELGVTVLGVDGDGERVRQAQGVLAQVFQADGTNKRALEQLGFQDLDCVVVSTGRSMEASLLVVLNLQELGVKKIWVKAVSVEHEKVLLRLGVSFAVIPEQYVARQIAHRLSVPGLLEYLGLGEGVLVKEVTVDKWHGNSLRELKLTSAYRVQVVAVKKLGAKAFDFVPAADDVLEKGDVLVVIGQADDVLKIVKG